MTIERRLKYLESEVARLSDVVARKATAIEPTNRLARVKTSKGWCTIRELADDLRFTITAPADPEDACRLWLRRHGIAAVKRGRTILVSSVDVENALRKVAAR